MSTFEQFNLPKSVLKAVEDLGFETPTPIQEKSFSVIMSGRDMMGIAQTGTGKTFAYLLPLLKLYKLTSFISGSLAILNSKLKGNNLKYVIPPQIFFCFLKLSHIWNALDYGNY